MWCETHRAARSVSRIRVMALSHALVRTGRPRGQVVQVTLRRPAHGPAYYVRGAPERTAVYDGEAIRWD